MKRLAAAAAMGENRLSRGDGDDVGRIESRLSELGIELPSPAAPVANYVPFVVHGGLVTISGQLCLGLEGKLAPEHVGTLGAGVSPETAKEAARLSAINVLAQLRAAAGGILRPAAGLSPPCAALLNSTAPCLNLSRY